jgi:hypothetical protein
LRELIAALQNERIVCMDPTGGDTAGLLEQVFARPDRDEAIPETLLGEIRRIDDNLAGVVRNAKLVELVSRREMDPPQRTKLMALYGFDPTDGNIADRFSAPIYNYFLPVQAAHVIRASTLGSAPGHAADRHHVAS